MVGLCSVQCVMYICIYDNFINTNVLVEAVDSSRPSIYNIIALINIGIRLTATYRKLINIDWPIIS